MRPHRALARKRRRGAQLAIAFLLIGCGLLGATPMQPSPVTSAAAVERIMPLGDSITDGYNVPGGYRIDLWPKLTNGGYSFDFVGSLVNGPDALPDRDHEGHSGWRIDHIHSQVTPWLQAYQPTIVLLQIGTNDILHDYNLSDAPNRLSALVDTITNELPTAQVFVASLTPLESPFNDQRVREFNAAIPGMVASKAAAGRRVAFVDVYPALTTSDLADGIHPNATGYGKLAEVWYSTLRGYLAATTPGTTPTSVPAGEGYREAVLADGPASYWRLGEAAGPTAADERGAAPGTYQGSLAFNQAGALTGAPHPAVLLSGGRVTLGDVYDFPGRAPWTLEAWIYPTLLDSYYRRVLSKESWRGDTVPATREGYTIGYQGQAGLFCGRFTGQVASELYAPGPPAQAWTQLVCSYDGTTLRLYRNGALAASTVSTLAQADTGLALTLGQLSEGGGEVRGRLDEVAVYPMALSAERIQAHYAAATR